MTRIKWSKDDEALIIDNITKMSVSELAESFHVPYNRMCEKLQRMKLKSKEQRGILWTEAENNVLKEHYEYAPSEYIMRLLPKRSWTSIKAQANRLGITKLSTDTSYVNYQFFNNWTQESAYVLGFILADGYIYNSNSRKYVQIEVNKSDIDILRKISNVMDLERRIYESKSRDSAKVMCANRNIVRQLIEKGIPVKDKSHNATFPESCPSTMIKHLIRGLIDGDGWSSYRDDLRGHMVYRIGFCGTYDVVSKLKSYLPEDCSDNKIQETNNCFSFNVTGLKAFKIADWLYRDATIYLDRKYSSYIQARIKYSPSLEKSSEDTE